MKIYKSAISKRISLFWDDLKPEVQRAIEKEMGDNGNYDMNPLIELEFEEEE